MDLLTLSQAEPLARRSALQADEADWVTNVATWRWNFARLLIESSPPGSFGKMCPESCQATKIGRLAPLSGNWSNSGMAFAGECLTLNLPEFNSTHLPFPNADAVCSLSDILETGDHLARYCLSAKACAGILRRAAKRGKVLPPHLEAALKNKAGDVVAVQDGEQSQDVTKQRVMVTVGRMRETAAKLPEAEAADLLTAAADMERLECPK